MYNPYDAGPPEPDEGTLAVTCGAEVSRRFVTPDLERAIKALTIAAKEDAEDAQRLFRKALDVSRAWQFAEDVEVECPFDGEVDAYYFQGRVSWTCPACGTDHDEDEDKYGPDPDRYHDEFRERD